MGPLLLMITIVVGLTALLHPQKIQKSCLEITQIRNVSLTALHPNLMVIKMIENVTVLVQDHLINLMQLK